MFWMLYDFMGHDRALAGLQRFIRTWSESRDHPALQDFVASMRPYARDPVAYDAFVKEWFEDRAMPEYRVTGAKKEKRAQGYDVTLTVRNTGTGRMPVEIAATSGERWAKPSKEPSYRESREGIVLGAGESKALTIHCSFSPDKVVVDPDVRVLQLNRKQATVSL